MNKWYKIVILIILLQLAFKGFKEIKKKMSIEANKKKESEAIRLCMKEKNETYTACKKKLAKDKQDRIINKFKEIGERAD